MVAGSATAAHGPRASRRWTRHHVRRIHQAAYCWSVNTSGQIGNGNETQEDVPTAVSTAGVLSGVTLTEIDPAAT